MQIVLLLVGLGFTAVGALLFWSEASARAGAVEVPAELVGFSGGKPGFFHAVARYAGPDGAVHYLESSVGSSSPLGSVGDRLSVLVQPGDPAKAAIKSPLTYVLSVAIAAMGLVSCAVFFATFRLDAFSLVGAGVVVGSLAFKARGTLRKTPMTPQGWKEYKARLLPVRLFTEATRAQIRWADAAAVEGAVRQHQRANRFAVPVLVLAGVGLVVLGGHLYRSTQRFLATAVAARGVVVDLARVPSSSGSSTWAPVVSFEEGGREARFKDSVSSNPPSYRSGDVVRVLYDPLDPANARIDRGRWNEGVPLLVAAFGALFLSAGAWLAFRRCTAPARP